jgi:hypothetical protein
MFAFRIDDKKSTRRAIIDFTAVGESRWNWWVIPSRAFDQAIGYVGEPMNFAFLIRYHDQETTDTDIKGYLESIGLNERRLSSLQASITFTTMREGSRKLDWWLLMFGSNNVGGANRTRLVITRTAAVDENGEGWDQWEMEPELAADGYVQAELYEFAGSLVAEGDFPFKLILTRVPPQATGH